MWSSQPQSGSFSMTPHTLPGRSSTLHQKVTFAKCSRGCFISTGLRWARSSSSLLHCGVSEVCIRIGCSQERIVLQALHGSSCLHSSVTKRLKIFTNHTEWGGTESHRGPSVQPLSKSRASTTPACSGHITNAFKDGDPTASASVFAYPHC